MDNNGELFLILHKVRGESAFDIASKIDIGADQGWIIPTSGHRAYPYRWWPLEDLADISDINNYGNHTRPASLDHTVPADWPDHYQTEGPRAALAKPRLGTPIDLGLLDLISSMEDE